MERDHKADKQRPPTPSLERGIGNDLLSALGMEPEDWTDADRRLAVLWIAVGLLILIIATGGYQFGWKWTGVTERTFWDWLSLLIVPFVLALGGYMFTRSESRRTEQQTDSDRDIAQQHRQDDMLQAYLNGMSQLLTDKDRPLHEEPPDSNRSTVARALTLTVLETLAAGVQDTGRRKRRVLRFLYEAALIGDQDRPAIVKLSRANLADADLSGADLRGVDLHGADLGVAEKSEANLSRTDLSGAHLKGLRMRVKDPEENKEIYKRLSNEELNAKGPFLKGATMPEGQKYEVWLGHR
jgi:hypothetical protein